MHYIELYPYAFEDIVPTNVDSDRTNTAVQGRDMDSNMKYSSFIQFKKVYAFILWM